MNLQHNRAITTGDRLRAGGDIGGRLSRLQITEKLKTMDNERVIWLASNASSQDWRDAALERAIKLGLFKRPKMKKSKKHHKNKA